MKGNYQRNRRRNGDNSKLSVILGKVAQREALPETSSFLAELGLSPTEQVLFRMHQVVGELEQVLPPPRFFRSVIFGSARVQPGDAVYEETRRLARSISENGIDIVTGGGPGLMEAASRGAMEGKRKSRRVWSWGVCIEQINRVEAPNNYLSHAYKHRNFFTRLHQFARLGGAGVFIVMPGGIGSLLELAMMWQLLQVGHMKRIPLIAVGDMWRDIAATMAKHMVPAGFARMDEIEIVTLAPTALDALPIALESYGRFKQLKAAG